MLPASESIALGTCRDHDTAHSLLFQNKKTFAAAAASSTLATGSLMPKQRQLLSFLFLFSFLFFFSFLFLFLLCIAKNAFASSSFLAHLLGNNKADGTRRSAVSPQGVLSRFTFVPSNMLAACCVPSHIHGLKKRVTQPLMVRNPFM